MMHPRDNLSSFSVWAANRNCGRSFHEAFTVGSYNQDYDNTSSIQLLRARYGTNEQILLLHADNSVLNFDETDYERLTKGIAGYNQGYSNGYWGAEVLANSLRRLNQIDYTEQGEERRCHLYPEGTNDRRRCIGYLYASDVKRRANIPLANYLWRTQVPMNVNGTMQPVDVCFWYGETEWRIRSWTAQRDLSVNNNSYSCPAINTP